MKTLLPSPSIDVFQAARTRLRVLVLAALVFALVLPASGYAGPAGAAGRHAYAGGIGISVHPAGLDAAIARDLGPAAARMTAAVPAATSVSQTQVLTAADGAANDGFGIRVALSVDETTALVSATGKKIGGNAGAGAVYVYTHAGSTWTQQQELTAADGAAKDGFGSPVALNSDGNVAVVGAFDKTIAGHPHAGAVYVFTRSANSTWSLQQELSLPAAATSDFFGAGVAVTGAGTSILVSASGKTLGSKASAGAAYMLR